MQVNALRFVEREEPLYESNGQTVSYTVKVLQYFTHNGKWVDVPTVREE